MAENPFQIVPTFLVASHPAIAAVVSAAEPIIETMIPESVAIPIRESPSLLHTQSHFFQLNRTLPLFKHEIVFPQGPHMGGLLLHVVCPAEFTGGVGRYITDIFTKWLVPAKRLYCASELNLAFQFVLCPEQKFYFQQKFFRFTHESDISMARSTVSRLIEDLRINILAVYRLRYLASLKSIPFEERQELMQQHLQSLFYPADVNADPTVYDQMHQFLLRLSQEEKFGWIKDNIRYLMHMRPESIDRTIYYEISAFSAHFRTSLAHSRDSRYISRIVAFHYLFKKALLQSLKEEPHERHISIKIVNSQLDGSDPVIGILMGMNLLKEGERFEVVHLLSAVQSCLPEVVAVADSFFVDRREEKIRIFYLEVKKPHHSSFLLSDIRHLKHSLPTILKRRVENVIHPIFMPRNEEEVLRNIVLLSKQIKFLRDLPHLTIHYEKQSDREISFLIVLVRLLKENDLPFKELSKGSSLKIAIDEIRSAGSLKRRCPKEAVVFRAIIDKAHFFRKDFSLDLKRARQQVVAELRKFIGEFRDYNGGMIHKQDEALEHLRKVIGAAATQHDILLENFFYSIRPGIMQTIHTAEHLSLLFKLLLEVLDEHLAHKGFSLKVLGEGKYFFAMIGACAPTFKEEVQSAVARLKIPSYDLTTTFLHIHEHATLGYVLRTEDLEKRAELQQTLLEAMLNWKINFSCSVGMMLGSNER